MAVKLQLNVTKKSGRKKKDRYEEIAILSHLFAVSNSFLGYD
jgi:hypothetical protein